MIGYLVGVLVYGLVYYMISRDLGTALSGMFWFSIGFFVGWTIIQLWAMKHE